MSEEFDFSAIFKDGEAEKIEVDEMETVIRESWGTITHVAGGIYKDSLENGLPNAIAEYVAKEFLYGAIHTLRGERL
jgi:hypothetical protein